ncbi:MAG: YbjQ family protein [Nannocystaceae bacterium]
MTTTPALRNAAALASRPGGAMMMTTTDEVAGYRIVRVLGLVRGNTVRTRNVGHDFLAGLRTLVGGEVTRYTAMLAQSREQALDRLRAEALELGANAVVGLRITTSTVMAAAAEILAYGTAVIIEEAR